MGTRAAGDGLWSTLTTVYIPVSALGSHYRATVSGAQVVSAPGASQLVLRTVRGASSVQLTVTR